MLYFSYSFKALGPNATQALETSLLIRWMPCYLYLVAFIVDPTLCMSVILYVIGKNIIQKTLKMINIWSGSFISSSFITFLLSSFNYI